ncbi:hypothetical protein LTS18_000125, partial [Coniosporium uncinatum]
MLEFGYTEMRPWTETWHDELNSAVDVGAIGEMKILHNLWPEKPKKDESRPGTATGRASLTLQREPHPAPEDPETERQEFVATAGDIIDTINGPDGPDNKAAGKTHYGKNGLPRSYLNAGVIFANEKEAYILPPALQPSNYYGRRPLANYIRKNRAIGVAVVRGFDQAAWDKLHPMKKSAKAEKARDGVSSSQAGAPPKRRQQEDTALKESERPVVTDLVLVVHGIGQKLSERVESYHFTHAINAFRREIN